MTGAAVAALVLLDIAAAVAFSVVLVDDGSKMKIPPLPTVRIVFAAIADGLVTRSVPA